MADGNLFARVGRLLVNMSNIPREGGRTLNVRRSDNLLRLQQIDAEIDSAREAVVTAERSLVRPSSQIIAAGVAMVEIALGDLAAWNGYKAGIGLETPCKGDGWEYREVVHVIWRSYQNGEDHPGLSRQRISDYGKAIRIAYRLRQPNGSSTNLVERIQASGGLKGLLRRDKHKPEALGEPNSVDNHVQGPSGPAHIQLAILRPGDPPEIVPDEVARPILVRLGALQ